MIKKCTTCKRELPIDNFGRAKQNVDGYNGICKECKKQYMKEYYKNNKQKYRNFTHNRYIKKKKAFNDLLSSHGCAHCGETNPIVLVCHHTNPENKVNGVAYIIDHGKWKDAMSEFKKCIVLCLNCHAIEHDRLRKEEKDAY